MRVRESGGTVGERPRERGRATDGEREGESRGGKDNEIECVYFSLFFIGIGQERTYRHPVFS